MMTKIIKNLLIMLVLCPLGLLGQVGIGTTTPSVHLHVSGSSTSFIGNYIDNTNADGFSNLSVRSDLSGINLQSVGSTDASLPAFQNWGRLTVDVASSGLVLQTNGADPMAFNTNSVERMRILSGGNVGIGTSSPSTLLHLKTSAKGHLTIEADDDDTDESHTFGILYSQDAGAVSGQFGFNGFDGQAPDGAAYTGAVNNALLITNDYTTVGAQGGIQFGTGQVRMTINRIGQIGVGTTTPSTTLHVEGGISALGDQGIRLSDNTAAGGFLKLKDFTNVASQYIPLIHGKGIGTGVNNRNGLVIYGEVGEDGADDVGIVLDGRNSASALSTANILEVRNYGTAEVVVDPDGRLGVGRTSPTIGAHIEKTSNTSFTNNPAVLGVYSSETAASGAGGGILFGGAFNGTTVTTWGYIGVVKENGTAGDYSGKMLLGTRKNGSAATDMTQMVIDSDGNVGIAELTPGALLDLEVSSAAVDGTKGVRIENSAGTIVMLENGSTHDSYVGTNSASNFHVRSNSTNRISVRSDNGNVGINETTPDGHFEISADGSTGGSALMVSSDDASDGDLFSVLESGNVGIGTTSPAGALNVQRPNNTFNSVIIGGDNGAVNVELAELAFRRSNYNPTEDAASIVFFRGTGANEGGLRIKTQNAAASLTTRININPGGNVGFGTESPLSTVHINGSVSVKRTSVAANYTILTSDYYVAVTSTAAPRTITLPSVVTSGSGKVFVIKDESGGAGTNNITLAGGGANIDGAASATISTNYGKLKVICDGTNWFITD